MAGFGRNQHRRRGLGFIGREGLGDLSHDVVGVYVAHDHVKNVGGNVAGTVVAHDVVPAKFVEDVRIANHRMPVRAGGVGGFKETPTGPATGVVLPHVDFAPDDVQLLFQLRFGQRGVLHDVAQNIHRYARASVGDINVIHSTIKGGVGVHVAAGLLHFLINAPQPAGFGSLEKHVLQDVRQSGPKPIAFMDAAGLGPGLGGHHGRAVIFAHDHGEAVIHCHQTGIPGGVKAGNRIERSIRHGRGA